MQVSFTLTKWISCLALTFLLPIPLQAQSHTEDFENWNTGNYDNRIFEIPGVQNGLDGGHLEIMEFQGSKVAKFTIVSTDQMNYRAEIYRWDKDDAKSAPNQNCTWWNWTYDIDGVPRVVPDYEDWNYEFSIYIPNDWKPDPVVEIVSQFHNGNGKECNKPATSPSLAIRVVGDRFEINRNPTPVAERYIKVGPSIERNKWYHFKVYAYWHPNNGVTKVWINENLEYDEVGPNTYSYETHHWFKVGVYKWLWQNPSEVAKSPGSGSKTRSYIYDNVKYYKAGTNNGGNNGGGSTGQLNCEPPPGFNSMDIGNVAYTGVSCDTSGQILVEASGEDIWNEEDAFHYVYVPMNQDISVTARVLDVGPSDPWAKGGIMIRESLTPNSKNTMMYLSHSKRWSFQRRTSDGSNTFSTKSDINSFSFPYWVKLEKSGNTISGYHSKDGQNWTLVDNESMNISDDYYIGLAVTSHNNTVLNQVLFDNVEVELGDQNTTFPVELLSFVAKPQPQKGEILFSWETAMEQNNDFFTLETSADGLMFKEVTTVDGKGNSQQAQTYYAKDDNPAIGTRYYRLKQTDIDGTFTYLDKLEVTYEAAKGGTMIAYPNPIPQGEQVQIELSMPEVDESAIQLTNATGQVLWTKIVQFHDQVKQQFPVDTRNLLPGIYYLQAIHPFEKLQSLGQIIMVSP